MKLDKKENQTTKVELEKDDGPLDIKVAEDCPVTVGLDGVVLQCRLNKEGYGVPNSVVEMWGKDQDAPHIKLTYAHNTCKNGVRVFLMVNYKNYTFDNEGNLIKI